jgi:NADPH-dependent 2,4-dienoyl-CoA reductase/sulfur reductase-like enzyme
MRRGRTLVKRFRASSAEYLPLTTAWQIDGECNVFTRGSGGALRLAAEADTDRDGAMERPVPIPGWTLQGVMTCGAAQTLLKSTGAVPDGRCVLAGSGPLLFLIAMQLVRAGIKPAALVETAPHRLAALRHLPAFLSRPAISAKACTCWTICARPASRSTAAPRNLQIHGDERVREFQYEWRGETRRVAADVVLLHQGIVPNMNLALSLRCAHAWDDAQRAFRPRLDSWGNTSVAGIQIAGDNGGIIGAQAAELSGHLAALGSACELQKISADERDRHAEPLRKQMQRHLGARPFLDTLYRAPQEVVAPREAETIVCRCEEVRRARYARS